jgi:hypothetical protein
VSTVAEQVIDLGRPPPLAYLRFGQGSAVIRGCFPALNKVLPVAIVDPNLALTASPADWHKLTTPPVSHRRVALRNATSDG